MILVTGATGFVGTRVLERSRGGPERVLALVGPGKILPRNEDVQRVEGRIERAEGWRERLAGVRTVIHLASKHLDVDGGGFTATNVDGTRALAEACRDAGVRHVIYLSSTGVYGHAAFDGADERTPLRPDTALARSKAAAERILATEFAEHFVTTVLRPRFIHGPGDRAFLPGIERALERHRVIPVSGRAKLSLVHVDDLAELCLRLAREEPAANGHLHVDDGREHTVRTLFERMAAARGTPPPRFLPVPLPLLYHPLRTFERLTGRDPEARPSGLTSRRLQFLGQDNRFSNAALTRRFPDLRFRELELARDDRRACAG